MERAVAPSREDGVVRAASEVLGGPAGRRVADRRTAWGAAPVLAFAATVTTAASLVTRQHCRSTGWSGSQEFLHACYSDVPALVATHAAASQPPVTALVLRLLAVIAPSPRASFDASVLLTAVSLVVAVVCVARVAGVRRWDAALVALSPVVVFAGLVSVDVVGVALMAAALLAWGRSRPLLAGVLLGACAGVRPAAALVVVALWIVALVRSRDTVGEVGAGVGAPVGEDELAEPAPPPLPQLRPDVLAAALATVGALTAAGVATLASRVGTSAMPGGSTWLPGGGAGYGSLWLLPSLAHRTGQTGHPIPSGVVVPLSWVALVAVVAAGVAAAARTARAGADGRASLPAVALVVVAGALAVAPAVPVQATLVVLPLAALAAPRWRDHLPWGVAEAACATGTWLYIYGLDAADHRGLPPWAYVTLVVLRLGALAWLAVAGVSAVGRVPGLACGRAERPVRSGR